MSVTKATLICTVLNEAKTVGKLIDSIAKQSLLPFEVIIIDGESRDNTIDILNNKKKQFSKLFNLKIIVKKGNRSVGRNEGIRRASSDIILLTDSGCILDKDWVKEITKPFLDNRTDVVAGYYKGQGEDIFQKSLIPYVLVMPDKIDENDFLPATRSMALRKQIWEKTGGFNEELSHNEDYAFANKLKKMGAKIVFAKDAIVSWVPRKNLKEAFVMFFRFALGDAEAKIFRDKVFFIFLRYIFVLYLIMLSFVIKSVYLNGFILSAFLFYIAWSIFKNYKYVNDYKAFVFLPLFQFTSDIAVLIGTTYGIIKTLSLKKILGIILNNKAVASIILVYSLVMLLLIQWGIPGLSHPFNYAMDEWHFSQALRTFIKYGTGSVSGAASIPLYHIVSSILFLIPFYILRVVNPQAIKFTLDNLPMQNTLFEILRLHTLFYGVLSTITIYKLNKNYIKFSPVIFAAFFVFNPILISLTNYYKYDITLSFWIIATVYLLFKYFKTQKFVHFIFIGIALGLALSTKFTAAPLLISYVLGYFILSHKIKYKELAAGILTALFVFAFIGIPDLIFGNGNYYQLLYSTLVDSPKFSTIFNLGYPAWFFLIFKEFPSLFGYFLSYAFYISLLFWTSLFFFGKFFKSIKQNKMEFFVYISSILFLLSTVSFGLDGGGNRALTLLPFMILSSSLFLKHTFKMFISSQKYKNLLVGIFIAGLIIQIVQSISWISVKFYPDPRSTASAWILGNIPKNATIGIENIPIYQMLPDFVLKEFYFKQHNNNLKTRYKYSVISSQNRTFPKYVVITNDFDNLNYLTHSEKKDLVNRLKREKYKKINYFSPNLKYYNIFADKLNFVLVNVIPMPVTISVYEKL